MNGYGIAFCFTGRFLLSSVMQRLTDFLRNKVLLLLFLSLTVYFKSDFQKQ